MDALVGFGDVKLQNTDRAGIENGTRDSYSVVNFNSFKDPHTDRGRSDSRNTEQLLGAKIDD